MKIRMPPEKSSYSMSGLINVKCSKFRKSSINDSGSISQAVNKTRLCFSLYHKNVFYFIPTLKSTLPSFSEKQ